LTIFEERAFSSGQKNMQESTAGNTVVCAAFI
jgi:hypothetical protein